MIILDLFRTEKQFGINKISRLKAVACITVMHDWKLLHYFKSRSLRSAISTPGQSQEGNSQHAQHFQKRGPGLKCFIITINEIQIRFQRQAFVGATMGCPNNSCFDEGLTFKTSAPYTTYGDDHKHFNLRLSK